MRGVTAEFVIQIHSDYGPLHYDLMLARGEVLATWRLAVSPAELAEGREVRAKKLEDHRLAYLSYEGPVSRGRGRVAILDKGTYELLDEQEDRWEARFDGRLVKGTFELKRLRGSADEWTLSRLHEA